MLVDFLSTFDNSFSRAFRKLIFAQKKVATNLNECELGGDRTHKTDLYIPGSRIISYPTGATGLAWTKQD